MKDDYFLIIDGHDPVISTEETIHGHGDGIEGGGLCIDEGAAIG